MNEEPEKRKDQAKPAAITESTKRLRTKINFQMALDSMARLRLTIDRRPGRLTQMPKTADR